MLDQIESMEYAAERAYDQMDQGNGMLKCTCGKLFHYDDGHVVSPDPWAMPVCPDCFDEYMDQKEMDSIFDDIEKGEGA